MNLPLHYELKDGVANITMDDGKANVMSVRMMDALNSALDQAEADKAIVLLTGRTGLFSAGFDLSAFKNTDTTDTLKMLTMGARLSHRLLSHPQPIVVACNGHAIAMGMFILLCADVRVGLNTGAIFQANEVLIGMTLPHFVIEVFKQRLSPAHLSLTGITAQTYSGEQAVAAGILDEAVDPKHLITSIQAQIERLQKVHPASFKATKLRLRQTALQDLSKAIDRDIADWSGRFQKTL
jgi:enoyl-CoA hydratase